MPLAKKKPGQCKSMSRSGKRCTKKVHDNTGMCAAHRRMWLKKLAGPTTAEGKEVVGQNANKHGIYGHTFTKEEIARLPEVDAQLGTLDQEIRVVRLRLQRCADWILKLEDPEDPFDGFEDDSTTQKRTGAAFVIVDGNEVMRGGRGEIAKTRKRPDYYGMQDKLMARLGKLETQRRYLIGDAPEDSAAVLAAKIQAMLKGIGATTSPKETT